MSAAAARLGARVCAGLQALRSNVRVQSSRQVLAKGWNFGQNPNAAVRLPAAASIGITTHRTEGSVLRSSLDVRRNPAMGLASHRAVSQLLPSPVQVWMIAAFL
jgi:hypothetical protein